MDYYHREWIVQGKSMTMQQIAWNYSNIVNIIDARVYLWEKGLEDRQVQMATVGIAQPVRQKSQFVMEAFIVNQN